MGIPKVTFAGGLFISQIILVALFAKYVDYEPANPTHHSQHYTQFIDIHTMVFVGFALLMAFLKKYGFGAMSYTLMLSSQGIQWAIIMNAWVSQRVKDKEGHFTGDPLEIKLNVYSLITADFTAASIMISYGAVLGKASNLQLLIMTILETIFYAIDETLIFEYLHITDIGGSIPIHLFGAYFGLAVAAVIRNSGDEHPNEGSVVHADLFCVLGTLFLWILWPSFNSGPAGNSPARQNRAVVNTYLSLAACVATSFMVSTLVHKKFKLNMVHIQNATLAGGVAIGSSADLMVKPWGAILTGMMAGIISVLGYAYLTPFMSKYLKIHDTCGVHNLHGMPGVFGGIVGAIAAASIDQDKYPGDFGTLYPEVVKGRSQINQGGYMIAAVCVGLGMSIVGGIITGFIIKFLGPPKGDMLYNDENEFEVPEMVIDMPQVNGAYTNKSDVALEART